MAFSYTYNQLKDAVIEWLEDDSLEIQAAMPNIVNVAERQIIKDLNFSIFDETATGTLTSATLTKPSGWVDTLNLFITVDGQQVVLKPKPWDYVQLYGGTGTPIYYTEASPTAITVAPAPTSQPYTLRYIKRPTPLSEVASPGTTWLSANVPEVLLWQTILTALNFLKTDDRVEQASQFYNDAVEKTQVELSHLIRKVYR